MRSPLKLPNEKSVLDDLLSFVEVEHKEEINFVVNVMKQPVRLYHNMDHLLFMWHNHMKFREDDRFKYFYLNEHDVQTSLATAVFFHDYVYNVSAEKGANENRSAVLYARSVEKFSKHTASIINMILSTSDHWNYEEYTNVTCDTIEYFLDLDLMAFSLDYDDFKIVNDQITNEFIQYGLPKDITMSGRKKFFDSLIKKDHIFRTLPIRNMFDAKARENVRKFHQEILL